MEQFGDTFTIIEFNQRLVDAWSHPGETISFESSSLNHVVCMALLDLLASKNFEEIRQIVEGYKFLVENEVNDMGFPLSERNDVADYLKHIIDWLDLLQSAQNIGLKEITLSAVQERVVVTIRTVIAWIMAKSTEHTFTIRNY